jgi:hypothetical protein
MMRLKKQPPCFKLTVNPRSLSIYNTSGGFRMDNKTDNAPHQEHDFGSFDADGHRVFFKIDYYDETLEHHSPNPADPALTKRVITIMLADEY